MQLTLEEKKELSQLSGYFKKLEIAANHTGINLDDYISEFRDNGYAHLAVKESNAAAPQRKEAFQKSSRKEDKVKTVRAK